MSSAYYQRNGPMREPTERRLRNLIKRIAAGDCPRASYAEFEALISYAEIGPHLQLESALAADRSRGNIITSLHSHGCSACRNLPGVATKWLSENPGPGPTRGTVGER